MQQTTDLADSSPGKEVISPRFVRRNLRLLKLYRGVSAVEFILAFQTLLYRHEGLDTREIFWVASALPIFAALAEVPGGRIADRWGGKRALLCGVGLITSAFIVLGLARDFWSFFIAQALVGAGVGCRAGADQVLAYSIMKNTGSLDDNRKFEAMLIVWWCLGGVVGAFTGMWIASSIGIRAAAWLQLPVEIALIPVILRLKEGERPHKLSASRKRPSKETLRLFQFALRDHKGLKGLIVYCAALYTFVDVTLWLRPSYALEVGVKEGWFGAMMALEYGVTGASAWLIRKKNLGKEWTGAVRWLWVLMFVITICSVLLAVFPSVMTLLVLGGSYFVTGVWQPITTPIVNDFVEDDEVRATVLSIQNLMMRLCFVVTTPLVSWVADSASVSGALLFAAFLYGALCLCGLVIMKKHDG